MIERLGEVVNARPDLIRRGRHLTTRFLVEIGSDPYLVEVAQGRISQVSRGPFTMPSWSFALRAPADAWEEYFSATPKAGFHDLLGLVKLRLMHFEGDLQPLMANLRYVKEAFALLRPQACATPGEPR